MSQDTAVTRPQPATLPVPEDVKGIREKLIELHPTAVKGTVAEISPELRDAYDYAKWAIGYWQQQADAAALRIREQMGDAEKAVVDGKPVFSRRQYPVKGHWVEGFDNDALYPVAGR